MNIRSVPGKKDIGLWMTQLVCRLPSELPYLLETAMLGANVNLQECDEVHQTVLQWARVIDDFRPVNAHDDYRVPSMLAYDKYYQSNASRDILTKARQPYMASVKETVVEPMFTNQARLTRPGSFRIAHRTHPLRESVMQYLQPGRKNELKQVLTNAFKVVNEPTPNGELPLYDYYAESYRGCDTFNSQMFGCTWPHKCGGKTVSGQLGCQHSYAMVVTLINVFNAYKTHKKSRTGVIPADTYQEDCLILADELFLYASGLF
jgi:hypothetical protein